MAINSDFRGRIAEAAVPAHRIVKAGVSPNTVVLSTAATDKHLGTSDELDHTTGEVVDIAVGPVPMVTLGGTVEAGDMLTSDAQGRAIATTTPGHRYIGHAEHRGVVGDVITYHRSPGLI